MTIMQRKSRNESADEASAVQIEGGLEGMLKYSIGATAICLVLHRTWPLFRRQTLAGKAFLVSGAAMTGLVIGAERKLQRYEFKQRYLHNEERLRATMELARMGSVGSEEEITRWIAAERERDRLEDEAALSSSSSSPASSEFPLQSTLAAVASPTLSLLATQPRKDGNRFGESAAELEEDVLEILTKVED